MLWVGVVVLRETPYSAAPSGGEVHGEVTVGWIFTAIRVLHFHHRIRKISCYGTIDIITISTLTYDHPILTSTLQQCEQH